MRRVTLYIIYTLLTVACIPFLVGCGERVHDSLLRAESMVIENPDSALDILQEIRSEMWAEGKDTTMFSLVWAEAYYMRTKTLDDSVIRTISAVDKSLGEERYLIKDLLYGVYLYCQDSINAAHSRFLACNSAMSEKVNPYWKCLLNDYLAIIYLNSSDTALAKSHFLDVVKYAKMTEKEKNVVNAYCQMTAYYIEVGELDSALHYTQMALSNENILDSTLLAIVYHNLSLIFMERESIDSSDNNANISLKSSLKYNNKINDFSTLTYALMAQTFYKQDIPDSAMYYHQLVECGENNIAKQILYKFLCNYYDRYGRQDSAYKYRKLHDEMASVRMSSRPIVEIQKNVAMQRIADAEKAFVGHRWLIILVGLLLFILIVIPILWYFICKIGKASVYINHQKDLLSHQELHIMKQSKHIVALEGEYNQMVTEMQSLQEKSEQLKVQIKEKDKTIEETTRAKIEAETTRDEAHQLMLKERDRAEKYQSQTNRVNAKLIRSRKKVLDIVAAQGQMLLNELLDKHIVIGRYLDKMQIAIIKEAYINSADSRKQFIEALEQSIHTELDSTNLIFCILYNEQFCDKDILNKFNYNTSAFSSAKNRVRKVLKTADSTPTVRSLLAQFDHARHTQ